MRLPTGWLFASVLIIYDEIPRFVFFANYNILKFTPIIPIGIFSISIVRNSI